MAPMGLDCHAVPRWLMAPLAASPASFQPSKAAMTAGELSLLAASSSMPTTSLPYLPPGYVLDHDPRVGVAVSKALPQRAPPPPPGPGPLGAGPPGPGPLKGGFFSPINPNPGAGGGAGNQAPPGG